jgi:steroid 5-alpha reductase family enzyme
MASFRAALTLSASVIAAVNGAGFLVTAATQSHKVTDLCGTSAFIASAWATHTAAARAAGRPALGRGAPGRSLALTLLTTAWGVRLSSYLFGRVVRLGKDERLSKFFPADKDEPWLTGPSRYPLKLASFWAAQGAWAWVCLLPVTATAALVGRGGRVAGVGPGAALALTAAGTALVVEAVADAQKTAWRADPAHRGRFCGAGVYSVVRYPNYAAEIAFWAGVTAAAGPAVLAAAPWVAASPAASALMITKVSGIPPLEAAHEAAYGRDPAWRAYVARTPALVPRLAGLWKKEEGE